MVEDGREIINRQFDMGAVGGATELNGSLARLHVPFVYDEFVADYCLTKV